jgi:hypothetical protein
VSHNDGSVDSFSGHRVLDILRQHLEIEKLNGRASAIAEKIKRDRMQARLREAPQLGSQIRAAPPIPCRKTTATFVVAGVVFSAEVPMLSRGADTAAPNATTRTASRVV